LNETAARWLLVLHTAVGVAAVGAATHLVLWLREYRHGQFGRHRAVKRFAWLAFALSLGGFALGNAMYPTYRVEVRAAYLENSVAVAAATDAHQTAVAAAEARERGIPPAAIVASSASSDTVHRAAAQARWFDVKEHWIALGLMVSAALVLILSLWDPRTGGTALVPAVFGMAVVAAGTLWIAAIIGVMTASFRAI
jgi:hypothetical protein